MKYVIEPPSLLDARIRRALSPNGRAYWRKRSAGIAAVRYESYVLMMQALGWRQQIDGSMVKYTTSANADVLRHVRLSVDAAFPSAALMDADNAWAVVKASRDGIADALWPDTPAQIRDTRIELGELHLVSRRKEQRFALAVEVLHG